MTRFHWPWSRGEDGPITPDPEALEALRVQRIKAEGAKNRRRQSLPIVAAGKEIWERNHLVDSLVAAAHKIVEGS
jgi:hypothetical protein